MAKKGEQGHKCPPIPDGWYTVTGPAWRGEPVEQAQRMWAGWLRIMQRTGPMPRRINR